MRLPIFFSRSALLDHGAVICRHGDHVLVPEKIGRVQHVDMQGVALDPLAAVKEAAKQPNRRVDADPQSALDRVHRAHLVSDGTDATNSRRDVGRFREVTSAQKGFEQSGGS